MTGCGSASGEDGPEYIPNDTCLNCETELDSSSGEAFKSSPRVFVSPTELMFYSEAAAELPAQVLTIHNDTAQAVIVKNAYVIESPALIGAGGALYFSIEELGEEVYLDAGDAFAIDVSFFGDTQQRSALVIIETTHPSFPFFVVPVTGKVFLDEGIFGPAQ